MTTLHRSIVWLNKLSEWSSAPGKFDRGCAKWHVQGALTDCSGYVEWKLREGWEDDPDALAWDIIDEMRDGFKYGPDMVDEELCSDDERAGLLRLHAAIALMTEGEMRGI